MAVRAEGTGIPYGRLRALGRPVRRTAALTATLALALLALLVAEVKLARDETRRGAFLPPDATSVIALDLSASVYPGTYEIVGNALARLARVNEPAGLIAFSDIAYELVPPGTPGRELRSLLRFFTPTGIRRDQLPVNPWGEDFRRGTRISEGLRYARAVLRRDEVEQKSILLISDLETSPNDLTQLTTELVAVRREGIRLRIVPLRPSASRRRLFERLVGADAFVDVAPLAGPVRDRGERPSERLPWPFLLVGGVLTLALAANERLCGRLVLPPLRGAARTDA